MEYITVRDVMDELSISRGTAYKLMSVDGFPAIKVGRTYRIDKDQFSNWTRRQIGHQIILS